MAERRLVADIGATHARFSLADQGGLVGEPVVLPTRAYTDMGALLEELGRRLDSTGLSAACLALAGPVDGAGGRLTNADLAWDRAELTALLGCPVRLVNDFVAQARSLPHLEHVAQVGGRAPLPGAMKAVLGPGSGLGMGLLLPDRDRWRVLASEGGHAALAPGNPLELELTGILQGRLDHVSWESVLSGPGLVNLYQAVCVVWGVEPRAATPEWIVASGMSAEEPVCHQTLETFSGLLGAAAGALTLTAYALGGVYLAGGIVPRMEAFLRSGPLRRRFEEQGAMAALVRDVPLYLVLDPSPGLVGALACLDDGAAGVPGPA